MEFEVKIFGIKSKKIKRLSYLSKHQVLETFDEAPWEKIINQLKENNTPEKDSPHFGIENRKDNFVLLLTPINNAGWMIIYIQQVKYKVFFGLFPTTKTHITEKRKQDFKTVKDCIKLFLNQEYQSLEQICNENLLSIH